MKPDQFYKNKKTTPCRQEVVKLRAGNGTRTRDLDLGKVTLYQLSYSRNTSISVQGLQI